MPEPAKTSSGEGVHIGEKAQVLGDAIGGDKTEIKTHGGDAHVHHHTDQTKEVLKCGACGKRRVVVGGVDCPQCSTWVCDECYHTEE